MGEVKQTNFRIDSETADKFRFFCEENGYNQAKGFDYLMQVLELETAVQKLPERRLEIDNFKAVAMNLVDKFIASLDASVTSENELKKTHGEDLAKKDRRIVELENENEKNIQKLKDAETRAEEAEEKQRLAEHDSMQARMLQIAAEKTADDKIALAEMFQNQLKEAMDKLDDYPVLKERNRELEDELSKAYQSIKDNKKDAEIAQERAIAEIQKQMDKVVSDTEKKLDKAISEAEKQKAKELSELEREKEKHITELEIALSKSQTTAEEVQKQLNKLEQKYESMQERIAELKAQNSFLEKQLVAQKENDEE